MLNANIPVMHLGVWCRAEYLYNHDPAKRGQFVAVDVFAVRSLQGRALGFHVLVKENGAVVWNLPIAALVHNRNGELDLSHVPPATVELLQLWDCFSTQLAVTEFDHLFNRLCRVTLKDGTAVEGRYLFTVDWFDSNYADLPGDSGHKCAHVIALDDGRFAAQPNNRILFADPASISNPFSAIPDYRTNERVYFVENRSKWEAGSGYFYEVKA